MKWFGESGCARLVEISFSTKGWLMLIWNIKSFAEEEVHVSKLAKY